MKAIHPSRRLGFNLIAALVSVLGLASMAVAADQPAPAADSAVAAPADASAGAVENSVVKIFATFRNADLGKPWSKATPQEVSGSGVVIEGNRILTNAHVVHYASQIQVQAARSGTKVSAKVAFIATGIDLAVLTLDDPSFFDTHPPLPRAAKIPNTKDSVLVYGFPTGGNNLSITKGIVSRIEFANYNEGTGGLRVQIDAAINPGNSGGPAVVNNEMIGLAFSRLNNSQNIGYIIPGEEIELFLKDISSGHYTGKPAMFEVAQTFENTALRSFLKADPSLHGVVVFEPFDDDPSYPIKQWDIITKIGDTAVDDQGMVTLRPDLRVNYRYLVQNVAKDGKLPLTVVREGKAMAVSIPVAPKRPLVMPYLGEKYPSYYIFGPMCFTKVSQDFARAVVGSSGASAISWDIMGGPLVDRLADKPAFPGEDLVAVSAPFFPHKLSIGYDASPVGGVIKSVNGIVIKNLGHLAQVLNDSKDEYLKFEFYGHDIEPLVFPRQTMKDSTEEILSDNDIRAQGSPDVMTALADKPTN